MLVYVWKFHEIKRMGDEKLERPKLLSFLATISKTSIGFSRIFTIRYTTSTRFMVKAEGEQKGSAIYVWLFWGSMKTWGLRGTRGGYPLPPANGALYTIKKDETARFFSGKLLFLYKHIFRLHTAIATEKLSICNSTNLINKKNYTDWLFDNTANEKSDLVQTKTDIINRRTSYKLLLPIVLR